MIDDQIKMEIEQLMKLLDQLDNMIADSEPTAVTVSSPGQMYDEGFVGRQEQNAIVDEFANYHQQLTKLKWSCECILVGNTKNSQPEEYTPAQFLQALEDYQKVVVPKQVKAITSTREAIARLVSSIINAIKNLISSNQSEPTQTRKTEVEAKIDEIDNSASGLSKRFGHK